MVNYIKVQINMATYLKVLRGKKQTKLMYCVKNTQICLKYLFKYDNIQK